MIPQKIHYCWFSEDRKPQSIQRCIKSWKKVMPDFEIKCWDANSFDFESVPFVRDAMAAKKYAFAADYVRLYSLYTEGGVYLDSDVEAKKSFTPLLDNPFFCGTEAFYADNKLYYRIEPAIIGAEKGHPFVAECMEYYKKTGFAKHGYNKVMPDILSEIGQNYNYKHHNVFQLLENGITVFPTSIFTNDICPDKENKKDVYAIHHNAGSWIDYSDRGILFNFCRKHDLMSFYNKIEKILR